MDSLFSKYLDRVEHTDTIRFTGEVIRINGMLIESRGPQSVVGEVCSIEIPYSKESILAEVIGLDGTTVKLMAYGETKGIEIGSCVTASGEMLNVGVGRNLLGRVLDATGHAADRKGEIIPEAYYPAMASPPDALDRKTNKERIVTGIRAIDSLLPVWKGQRFAIMAGSGVGKSTLLGMISRNTNADVNVIALIGERGREIPDFIAKSLGPEGMKRSVLVISSSDQSPLCWIRGAYVATAVAEYFRDQGKDVMLMFDSVTRFARAQRDIGNAIGEPPTQRGYPPSVFSLLPKLLERAGSSSKGTITAFYTVLVDGGDMNEPIADNVRATLDGHVVLEPKLAHAFHYPPIDILASISRDSGEIMGPVTKQVYAKVRRLLAAYAQNEDMITVGAYKRGSSPDVDAAIDAHAAIEEFLMQGVDEPAPVRETLQKFGALVGLEIPEDELVLAESGGFTQH